MVNPIKRAWDIIAGSAKYAFSTVVAANRNFKHQRTNKYRQEALNQLLGRKTEKTQSKSRQDTATPELTQELLDNIARNPEKYAHLAKESPTPKVPKNSMGQRIANTMKKAFSKMRGSSSRSTLSAGKGKGQGQGRG